MLKTWNKQSCYCLVFCKQDICIIISYQSLLFFVFGFLLKRDNCLGCVQSTSSSHNSVPKARHLINCMTKCRLCQKNLHNFVLNIKNSCRSSCPLHFIAWIDRFFNCLLNFVSFKVNIHKLRYCHLSKLNQSSTWASPVNHNARYPYRKRINGIEQETNKVSVTWINRFRQQI